MLVTTYLFDGKWFTGSFGTTDGRAMVYIHDEQPGVWPVGLAFWAGHDPWGVIEEVRDED